MQRARGFALLIAILVVALLMLAAAGLRAGAPGLERDRVSDRALSQAREALIAYATDHPINDAVGPGYLPCPDLDNDGWAESTCGSLSGDSGQEQRLGRLPWKTLGLPDLRDGHGERLWYAVSSKYKGLLNCAASRACVDMTPATALGAITVRDGSGTVLLDGTIADASRATAGGAVAVVIAPGPPLERVASGARPGGLQRRACGPGECDADGVCTTQPPQRAAPCDPVNYLDVAPGLEDNADFVDRGDIAGRPLNTNGFVQGPVTRDGRIVVNDRVAAIAYGDVMPRIMRRVALEVAGCLRFYASRPENNGRYPWMAALCADPSLPMHDLAGATEGRVPDTPFDATAAAAMDARWWRTSPKAPETLAELPTRDAACRLAVPPDDAGPVRSAPPATPSQEASTAGSSSPSWWNAWKPYVSVAMGTAYAPAPQGSCASGGCVDIVKADGSIASKAREAAVVVRKNAASCGAPLVQCDGSGCRVAVPDGDAIAWLPP